MMSPITQPGQLRAPQKNYAEVTKVVAPPKFAFPVFVKKKPIDEAALRKIDEAYERLAAIASPENALHEFAILSQHDAAFKAFLRFFQCDWSDIEKLVLLSLFKNKTEEFKVEELFGAMEYASRYRGLLPASLASIRYYQALQFFDQKPANSFADALRIAPHLDPEETFRNIAFDFRIDKFQHLVDPLLAVTYFNNAKIIDGMEAFLVEDFVCIRRTRASASINYAEAVISSAEFVRFALSIYSDGRRAALEILNTNGARASFCYPIIRTYLDHYAADEELLIGEMLAVVRGKPAFVSQPRFLAEPRNQPLKVQGPIRSTRPSLPPAHSEARPAHAIQVISAKSEA